MLTTRLLRFFVTCLSLALMFAAAQRCDADDDKMFGRLDVMFWTLDSPNSVVAINENTLESRLQLKDADFDNASFPRISFGRDIGENFFVEAVYFGSSGFAGSATTVGANDLSLPGAVALPTLDFFDADSMTLTTTAEMHNAELNIKVGDPTDYQLLGGFRYFRFDEYMNVQSTDSDSGTSDYRVNATSNLFGFQVGGEKVFSWRQWLLRGTGKAGIFGGDIQQSTFLGDFNNTAVLRNSKTGGQDVAFLGEIGTSLGYALTNKVSLGGGYGLLWVEGIARAGEQLDFTDRLTSGTALREHGGAFMHGATISLVYRY